MGHFFNQVVVGLKRIPRNLEPLRKEYNAEVIRSQTSNEGGRADSNGGDKEEPIVDVLPTSDGVKPVRRTRKVKSRKTRNNKRS